MKVILFILFTSVSGATVRRVMPNAPTYELSAQDVVCSGHMIKMFDANDGTYNPGLSTANEAGECAEACRTRLDPSSTSLYQWGTAISNGFWLKRTVGSPEDGECHCTFSDTVCEPFSGAFAFYDSYVFITTDSICRSASTEEIQGNYVRADCSCEYGFAGVFCTEPRMTCILGGVEAPDGESCDCRDDRMNNTGGCCPLGTVFAAADYSSFTPFQAMYPMADQNYYKQAFNDICKPHVGISQNETATELDLGRSVFNYVTDAQEIRVVRQADDCTFSTAKVDFLYDYEYVTDGWCNDNPNDKVIVYDRGWINNEKTRNGYDIVENKGASWEDMVRNCFEACVQKYPAEGRALDSHTDYGWKYNTNSEGKRLGDRLIHGFTVIKSEKSFDIETSGMCYCLYESSMTPKVNCDTYDNEGKSETYRIISAPMGCLEVDSKDHTRVMNIGKSHIYTYDTKPRPMVKGSIYEPQPNRFTPLHEWGSRRVLFSPIEENVQSTYSLADQITSHHCKRGEFESYEDWIQCATRSCQKFSSRGGASLKRVMISADDSGDVTCFNDIQGSYGTGTPKTATSVSESWKNSVPGPDCPGHIVQVKPAFTVHEVTSGTCESHGFKRINDLATCQNIARDRGYEVQNAQTKSTRFETYTGNICAFEAPVLDDKLKANGKFDSLKELTDVSYNGDEEDCYRICLNTDNAHGGDGELRWWDVFTAQDVLAGWYTNNACQCLTLKHMSCPAAEYDNNPAKKPYLVHQGKGNIPVARCLCQQRVLIASPLIRTITLFPYIRLIRFQVIRTTKNYTTATQRVRIYIRMTSSMLMMVLVTFFGFDT